jgi:hypothetical protein
MRIFAPAEVSFQMLFGMTSMIPTRPAHVTFPGLMGNFIRLSSLFRIAAAGGTARSRRKHQ